MGGLFGGAQTVNTGQQTAQAANQSYASSNVNAANSIAQGLGQEAAGLLSVYSQPGWGGSEGFQAQNPYSLYQLPDLNATQTTAIGQLGQAGTTGADFVNQGAQYYPQAGGYISQGAGLMGQAGEAITPEDINSFQNPFQANVTANLQDIFGQQNTQNLLGSTQAAGGTGGERAAVGQALLAQRQGLTAGNIYADLYQRSLQAAEQQKAQQLAAGQGLVGAGGSIGNLGLQGLGAGVGAENAALQAGNVQYNRDVQAQALLRNWYLQSYQAPMQQAAGIAQAMYPMIGLGQSGAQTGTSQIGQFGIGSGSTTYPAPSPLGGLAGLGLTGAALFAARGGRIKKKHKFDLGGAVDSLEGTPGSDGLMQPQGLEDSGDSSPVPLQGQGQDPSQQQQVQVPGTSRQDQQAVGPTSQTPQNPYPVPKFMGGSPQQSLQRRNQYALMSALISNQARQQLPAPQIRWPQMRRQEGGRVPHLDTTTTSKFSPDAYLNPKDEETEAAVHFKLTPQWGMSRQANPYWNKGDKNNLAGDMIDPGMRFPMMTDPRYRPGAAPPSGEAPGLYADGGAVGEEEQTGSPRDLDMDVPGLQTMSPTAQAALSDDDDDDDEVGGEAAPLGGAPNPTAQVNQVLSPYDTGVNPSVGSPGPNAGGMSPGKLALLQAGLGMMAASGQRDRHGLPMSPLAAIGQGGMQGVGTYQTQQALAQRERAAQAALGLKQAQMQALESHRRTTENFAREHLDLQKQRMSAGLFDDDTVNMMAEQAIAGDKSVFSNLGRGMQGPQNIERVRRRMNELAQERGMKGSDIAALNTNFTAQTAAAKTAATREANVQTAVNEAKATFPLAIEASQGVSRKDFVPYNQLLKLYREKTSNPAQARLAVALQGTITAYSQAMSRTGVNTVHAQERADHLLDDVTSHETLVAKLHQMELEMNAALKAPEATRKSILDKISGKSPGGNLDVEDILNKGTGTDQRTNQLKSEAQEPFDEKKEHDGKTYYRYGSKWYTAPR